MDSGGCHRPPGVLALTFGKNLTCVNVCARGCIHPAAPGSDLAHAPHFREGRGLNNVADCPAPRRRRGSAACFLPRNAQRPVDLPQCPTTAERRPDLPRAAHQRGRAACSCGVCCFSFFHRTARVANLYRLSCGNILSVYDGALHSRHFRIPGALSGTEPAIRRTQLAVR
jgi:hypothetical protein